MYLGFFACTHDKNNFDGQIMLERVPHAKVLTRAPKNQNFTEDMYVNEATKNGEWGQLIVDSITVDKLKVQMQNNYSLGWFCGREVPFFI